MHLRKKSAMFMLGGALYSVIELLWRGYTHWTMSVTGGACFTLLNTLFSKMEKSCMIKKCVCGSIIICAVEFTAGIIINKLFNLKIWDYSKRFLNIGGQICPLYAFLWSLLCMPVSCFSDFINKRLEI